MSGPDKVDRLLREWEDVASTARPPARDPRRSVQTASALPASLLLVAAVAVAVIAIVGRGAPSPQVAATREPSLVGIASPQPVDVGLTDLGVFDDGRFRVELTASGSTFEEGETIRAGAEVTFLGPEGSVRLGHGSPPVTFLVEELGGGRRSAGTGTDTVCLSSTFRRDAAIPFPWRRGGSWSPDNASPNDLFNMDYVEGWSGAQDGELRLPAGTWRLSATLDAAEGDCGPSRPRTASIVIRVDPAPGPAAPEPQPVVKVGPVVICDRVSAEDCEQAVALVRDARDPFLVGGREAFSSTWVVVVADTCTPGAVCDRMHAFDATVLFVFPGDRVGTRTAAAVLGTDGPEVALPGEGIVPAWMEELVAEAKARTAVPIALPVLREDRPECPASTVSGLAVQHDTWGVALRPVIGGDPELYGDPIPVIWPFAWSATRNRDEVALIDADGNVLVDLPRHVMVSGATMNGEIVVTCGVGHVGVPVLQQVSP